MAVRPSVDSSSLCLHWGDANLEMPHWYKRIVTVCTKRFVQTILFVLVIALSCIASRAAEGGTDAIVTPGVPAQVQQKPEYHQAQMRLAGPTCGVCLHELDSKLKSVSGVAQSKIERPELSYYSSYSPDLSSWTQGTIVFDANKVTLVMLKKVIHEFGYHAYKIQERLLDKLPEESPIKTLR